MKTCKWIMILVSLSAGAALTCLAEKPDDARGERLGPPPEMRERLLKHFDADGDGQLNEEERAKAKEARKKMRAQHGDKLKQFDKDGDGQLNEEERQEARKAHQKHREKMLKKFDEDGDGKLNEEEREKAREKMQKKRDGKGECDGDKDGKKKKKKGPQEEEA